MFGNWLPLPMRGKKQSAFVKYALSYLLFLFIPIVFGAQQYIQTHQVLTRDATELNLQILRMSQNIVDRLFVESDNVASVISVDNDVLRLLQSANSPATAEQLYEFSLLRDSLNRYAVTNKLFQDIFVCFQSSGTVVTSKTAFDMRDNDVRIEGKPFREWLDEVSKRSTQKQYYNLNKVEIGGKESSMIAYVSPLPNGVQGKVLGSIIVFIDQSDITGLFQRLVVKGNGYAYIQDGQGQLIAPTFSPVELARGMTLPASFEGKVGSSFQQLGGKSMLVSHSRSDQNGWTYVAAQSSEIVLAKAEAIKRTILTFASITLGLGVLAAFFLAYRNSRPLLELMSSLSELRNRIEHQLPLLRATVLDRLLKGYYKSEDDALAAVREGRMQLRFGGYFAVAASVSCDERYADTEELREFLASRLKVWFDGCDYVLNMDRDRADLIVSCPEDDPDALRSGLKRRWDEQSGLLQGENGMFVTLGIGRMTASLLELWRSHNDARQALEYHIPTGRGDMIWYEERVQDSGYYYYPLDLELKLVQTVKNGDSDGLGQLLRHIKDVNYSERRLNGATRRQLQHELQGTMTKLLEQLEAGSETFPELRGKLAAEGAADGEPFRFDAWQRSLKTICEHLAQQKKDKYNQTAAAMLDMTTDRFTDPNFSLAGLAAHFKLSESFISILFKEHAGENFSDYVERLRLELACSQLRNTGKSIVQIAQEIGYNSDKTFRRAFKRVYGVQPTSYRDSAPS